MFSLSFVSQELASEHIVEDHAPFFPDERVLAFLRFRWASRLSGRLGTIGVRGRASGAGMRWRAITIGVRRRTRWAARECSRTSWRASRRASRQARNMRRKRRSSCKAVRGSENDRGRSQDRGGGGRESHGG